MNSPIAIAMLAMLLIACSSCKAAPAWYEPFLPESAGGWQCAGPAAEYDDSNIFDYMDGAGELYLAYSFQALAVREYTGHGGAKLAAEVYRMSSPREAFGVYSAERSPKAPTDKTALTIGRDRDFGFGMLRFWQSSYFVRLLADKQTPEALAGVLAIGKHIAGQLPPGGDRPDILALLPKKALLQSSVRYFHKHTLLNYHYYLSDSNLLNLGSKTDALLAQYQMGKSKPRLLIVRYPNSKDARSAFSGFTSIYLKAKVSPGASAHMQKIEGGKYVGAMVQSTVLRLVFEAESLQQCRELLAGTAAAGRC